MRLKTDENFNIVICRQHFLQCPQGLLNKHFEKLIQCDMRLNFLSRQPEINLESPYFEPRSSICEDAEEFKGDQLERKGPSFSGFQNLASPAAYSSSLEIEKGEPSGIGSEQMSREAPSPSSGTRTICSLSSEVLMFYPFFAKFLLLQFFFIEIYWEKNLVLVMTL